MKLGGVLVIGCGGTGSHLIPDLARVLHYHPNAEGSSLVVCDGDEVEEKNLERQNLTMPLNSDNHINKALDLATQVRHLKDVEAWPRFINGPEDLHDWMWAERRKQAKDPSVLSVILCCVDNDMTRSYIYDAVDEIKFSVCVIDPANDLATGNVNTYYRLQDDSMKFAPFLHPREKYGQIKDPPDRSPGGGCAAQTPSTPQLITANKMAAVLALHQVINLLDDEDLYEEVMFDLRRPIVGNAGSTLKGMKNVKVEAVAATPVANGGAEGPTDVNVDPQGVQGDSALRGPFDLDGH